MTRLRDVHSLLVLLATAYFVLIAVLNASLAVSGAISLQTYISANSLVFVNIVFGFIYLLYVTHWKNEIPLRYENTDPLKFAAFAAVGALLHLLLTFAQLYLFSVSSVTSALYYALLGSAYAFVAITENAFFIGVVADYVATRLSSGRRANAVAALVSGVLAGAVAGLFHMGVYGSSPTGLLVVAVMFGYWAFASLEMRSTLYADLHHAIGNYIGFVYSVVQVVM